jgi:protoporphyrinogen oxidase
VLKPSESDFQDLVLLRDRAKNQSIWRLKNGMEEMVEKLVKKLSEDETIRLHLNEPIEKLEFERESNLTKKTVRIKSRSFDEKVDMVISSIYSKCKVKVNILQKRSQRQNFTFLFKLFQQIIHIFCRINITS